jgi:hypothetical protein
LLDNSIISLILPNNCGKKFCFKSRTVQSSFLCAETSSTSSKGTLSAPGTEHSKAKFCACVAYKMAPIPTTCTGGTADRFLFQEIKLTTRFTLFRRSHFMDRLIVCKICASVIGYNNHNYEHFSDSYILNKFIIFVIFANINSPKAPSDYGIFGKSKILIKRRFFFLFCIYLQRSS